MDICDWLREILKNGPKDCVDVKAAAKKAGYSRFQLKEAREFCGVKTTNDWTAAKSGASRWLWEIPEDWK